MSKNKLQGNEGGNLHQSEEASYPFRLRGRKDFIDFVNEGVGERKWGK